MIRNKSKDEKLRREFLPEALELVETPAAPWGHLGIWIICGVVAAMFLWSVFGKMDVTVTARGKLTAGGESGVQVVQPEEIGRIKNILVREGEHVKEGDVLLELVSESEADVSQYQEDAQEETRYKQKLLYCLKKGKKLEKFRQKKYSEVYQFVLAVRDKYNRKEEELRQQMESAKEEYRGIQDEIQILEREEKDYRELSESGAVARAEWEEKKNILQGKTRDGKSMEEQIKGLENSIKSLRSEYDSELSSLILECHNELQQGEVVTDKSREDLEKLTLRAPVAGIVKSVLVNTVGGVVNPAQELVEIVPEADKCVMELAVRNQDIGYITLDQPVSIRFDAYDYQKYGKAEGRVEYISADSFSDDKMGEVYIVKVSLPESERNKIFKAAETVAGLQGTAEIKTGERRIIEFFIQPLWEHAEGTLNIP